jgi:hypothetical protein
MPRKRKTLLEMVKEQQVRNGRPRPLPPDGYPADQRMDCDDTPLPGAGDTARAGEMLEELEGQGPSEATPAPWPAPVRFHEFSELSAPRFPVGRLPGWLARWAQAEAEATQTPPDMAAVLTLAVCGAALAKRFRVVARAGWTEPTNLYAVVVLAPGNRKSAVHEHATEPVRLYEQVELEKAAPRLAEAESRFRILEGRMKAAEKRAATVKELHARQEAEVEAKQLAKDVAALVLAAPPQFYADDVTMERLGALLADQGGRLLISSAEGTIFEIALGRYSEKPNFEILLKGHSGDDVRADRVNREANHVPQPALTMALTVQPDVLAGLAGNASARGRGLLARIWYSIPASPLGHRRIAPPPMPSTVKREYIARMLELLNLPGAVDNEGRPAPHLLALSPEADHVLQDFERWIEPQLAEGGDLAHLADWAGKLAGAAVRLAGVFHMAARVGAGEPWAVPISAETVSDAVTIGRDYLLPHAKRAFGLMGADPEVGLAEAVLRWIGRHGKRNFTRADVYQHLRHQVKRVEDLDPALARLERHNYVRRTRQAREGPGRPPPDVFDVNPGYQPEAPAATLDPMTDNSGNSGITPAWTNSLNSLNSLSGPPPASDAEEEGEWAA